MRPALSQIKLLIKPLAVGGDRTSALGVKFLSDVPPRLSLAEGDVLLTAASAVPARCRDRRPLLLHQSPALPSPRTPSAQVVALKGAASFVPTPSNRPAIDRPAIVVSRDSAASRPPSWPPAPAPPLAATSSSESSGGVTAADLKHLPARHLKRTLRRRKHAVVAGGAEARLLLCPQRQQQAEGALPLRAAPLVTLRCGGRVGEGVR